MKNIFITFIMASLMYGCATANTVTRHYPTWTHSDHGTVDHEHPIFVAARDSCLDALPPRQYLTKKPTAGEKLAASLLNGTVAAITHGTPSQGLQSRVKASDLGETGRHNKKVQIELQERAELRNSCLNQAGWTRNAPNI